MKWELFLFEMNERMSAEFNQPLTEPPQHHYSYKKHFPLVNYIHVNIIDQFGGVIGLTARYCFLKLSLASYSKVNWYCITVEMILIIISSLFISFRQLMVRRGLSRGSLNPSFRLLGIISLIQLALSVSWQLYQWKKVNGENEERPVSERWVQLLR